MSPVHAKNVLPVAAVAEIAALVVNTAAVVVVAAVTVEIVAEIAGVATKSRT